MAPTLQGRRALTLLIPEENVSVLLTVGPDTEPTPYLHPQALDRDLCGGSSGSSPLRNNDPIPNLYSGPPIKSPPPELSVAQFYIPSELGYVGINLL